MAMQPITSGRRIIFGFLNKLGVQLGDKIKEQGWLYFFSLNIPTYPNLVRTFYEHLIIGEEHIESTIKGKRIIISEASLDSLLEMPIEGYKYLVLKDKMKALRIVLERDDVDENEIVKASSLSLEMRLLHNFISRIFLPRFDRFD